jgi:uncharacterized protein (DUF1501 family)
MPAMHTTRRRFLQQTLGSSVLLSAGLDVPRFLAASAEAATAQGKPASDNVLVVVQLTGGNDGLNTVIPYGDDAYGQNRIALRIPEAQILKIDSHIGLHPQLKALHGLLDKQQLAIVQGVGYPNPDRSHFRSMDIWQSARPEEEHPRDGWLGRALECSPRESAGEVPALHLGANQLPLALDSRKIAVPSIESMETFRFRTSGGALPLAALRSLADVQRPGASPMLDFLRRSTLNAYASSEQVQEALDEGKNQTKYPTYFDLAEKLKNVAQLIDAGLATRIYYVSLNGFDTHASQAPAHSSLLRELAESVAAFIEDLTARGHADRVLVMGFSEFGRRVHENASQGTDHGTAAPVLFAGSKLASGLVGKHPSLTDLDQGDLKFHTDFRRLYATVLDGWLGFPSQTVLGSRYEPLKLFA